jgi:ABC-type transport system involved in multi-copper enzyme maturation permease subunit
MNPMIRKEMNLRMRERRGWILPSLYLLALGAVAALVYYATSTEFFRQLRGADIGVPMFIGAAFSQMGLLLLLAPIFSAGSITIEKEQRTMAGLLTSLLTPLQIWWGKFVASLLFVLLLIVIGLPLLSMSFAFGGIGPWEVGMVTLSTVISLAAVSAIGIYWSSVFRRTVHATAVTYATIIMMTVVSMIIFVMEGTMYHPDSWQKMSFWTKAPLYFNPVFFLTMGMAPAESLYPEWVRSLVVLVLLTLAAILLTLFNLRRASEQV